MISNLKIVDEFYIKCICKLRLIKHIDVNLQFEEYVRSSLYYFAKMYVYRRDSLEIILGFNENHFQTFETYYRKMFLALKFILTRTIL